MQGVVGWKEDSSVPEKLLGAAQQCFGLLHAAGFLENERLELLDCVTVECAGTKMRPNPRLMVRHGMLPFGVVIDLGDVDPELGRRGRKKCLVDFEWLLTWQAIVDPREDNLIGKPKAISGASTSLNFRKILVGQLRLTSERYLLLNHRVVPWVCDENERFLSRYAPMKWSGFLRPHV